MNTLRPWPLLAALLLSSTGVSAENHDVVITGNSFSPAELTVQVGDTVTFRNQSGGVHNAVTDPGAANTFRCANGCDATGGSGSPSAANWTAVVTLTNPGLTPYYCAIHGGPGGEGMSGTILVVGSPPADPPIVRDDYAPFDLTFFPARTIQVLLNDIFEPSAMTGGSLTIIQPPSQGSAVVLEGGDTSTPVDDNIRYTLPAGPADTTIGYRLCDGDGLCDDGEVRVLARALAEELASIGGLSDAGMNGAALEDLPAMPEARIETSPLVSPQTSAQDAPVDATPGTPWDAGRAGTTTTLGTLPPPADGLPQTWTVIGHAYGVDARVDLFLGLDVDGDGVPEQDELRCTSASSGTATEICEFRFEHPGDATVRYWAMVQNVDTSVVTAHLELAAVPDRPGDAGFVATGPGHLAAGERSLMRFVWDVPTLLDDEVVYGTLLVRPTPGTDLGRAPVRLFHNGLPAVGRALASGRDLAIRLGAGSAHERLFVDVPPGATSLTVTTASDANIDLYLSRHATLTHPAIQAAPARGLAVASATTASGDETLTLAPPQLVAGRWYVTPVNTTGASAAVVVNATVSAAAPVVRSGSYFNPDRSGHGMFIYPAGAGAVWTVLWYHYFEDGSPTWYYLEGAAPGANGVFTSPVYRSAWDGDSNLLVPVGEATLTPSGPDAFTWSYRVDGFSGAEPLVALGRDCPSVDGVDRDSSSTWFDPATAGTGYSVQLFPNAGGPGYEYTAAFVYDGHGHPRYLAAELPSAGPATHTYALEQLTGFCPSCDRTGAPTRQDVGTFTRTYTGGALSRIEVDAIYVDGIPGAWTGDDMVQPLGGEETVQGCDP